MSRKKLAIDDLAMFGGQALFPSPRSIGQLAVPQKSRFLGLVREAYDARRLSNDGPLVRALESRLAEFHEVEHCIAVANAGLGLMMVMQALAGGRCGEVIMPAFSFRGLPHFARWAGQAPRFCDVDPKHHMAAAASVASLITPDTTIILGVCNFNGCGDLAALERLAAERRLPLLLDSVYAIGSNYQGNPLGRHGAAEVFSLHATKLINGFEGGYITTQDQRLAAILRQQRNFCFPNSAEFPPQDFPWVHGLNAKLNEVHAALALATLDELGGIVNRNKVRHAAYGRVLKDIPGIRLLPCVDADEEPSAYLMAIAEIGPDWLLSRDETLALLRAEGCSINPYYSPALHRSPDGDSGAAPSCLPVSEELASLFLQLPFGEKMSESDILSLGRFLQFVSRHKREIVERLRKKGDRS